jgi:hypothetical protein
MGVLLKRRSSRYPSGGDGRGEDLDLVGSQSRPLIENLEHGVFSLGAFSF